VDAHDKLYENDESQEEVYWREGHVVGEVDLLALAALELDVAVARPVEADAVAGTVITALLLHYARCKGQESSSPGYES